MIELLFVIGLCLAGLSTMLLGIGVWLHLRWHERQGK